MRREGYLERGGRQQGHDNKNYSMRGNTLATKKAAKKSAKKAPAKKAAKKSAKKATKKAAKKK
jgi:hypothetical protein